MRYGCLLAPWFAVQAVIRSEPGLRGRPLAVISGLAPDLTVVEASGLARNRGVEPGMSGAEAMARCPGIVFRPRDPERERSAQQALLEAAHACSPRLEDGGPGLAYLDLAGLRRLLGPESRIARRLARRMAALGLEARVGVAGSRAAALYAARGRGGITLVPPGQERAFLAPAPLGILEMSPELTEVLARWGVRTLGELARLPATGLVQRLGQDAGRLQRLARGEDDRPLRPWSPPEEVEEALELDYALDALEPASFLLARLLERLAARLATRDLATDALHLALGLEDRRRHEWDLPLAHPVRDPRLLLALVRARLEADPPPAPIQAITVRARPVPPRALQLSLYEPPHPSPAALALTLARLAALVGERNVGSPRLLDSHRPEAFGLEPFAPPAPAAALHAPDGRLPALALRRLRPPRAAEVVTLGARPIRVVTREICGEVLRCAGPWRASGEWWGEAAWSRDEWDVQLADGGVHRLVLDRARGGWYLEGVYD